MAFVYNENNSPAQNESRRQQEQILADNHNGLPPNPENFSYEDYTRDQLKNSDPATAADYNMQNGESARYDLFGERGLANKHGQAYGDAANGALARGISVNDNTNATINVDRAKIQDAQSHLNNQMQGNGPSMAGFATNQGLAQSAAAAMSRNNGIGTATRGAIVGSGAGGLAAAHGGMSQLENEMAGAGRNLQGSYGNLAKQDIGLSQVAQRLNSDEYNNRKNTEIAYKTLAQQGQMDKAAQMKQYYDISIMNAQRQSQLAQARRDAQTNQILGGVKAGAQVVGTVAAL